MEHLDVLIVGAGLSGIGAGYHLQKLCPGRSYAILEGRERSGGTWDLFRYPGIRSDSDMYTLGYSFKPWQDAKAIADGPAILDYVRRTASDNGIERHIRYRHRVLRAAWSSADALWTVEVARGEAAEPLRLSCNFLFMCSGYYNYEAGYMPAFPGMERFGGRLVHPQQWPQDLDYKAKRVVVIGSGATAVTLVPAMAQSAAHVTMLQRSPTYILSLPQKDRIANGLRRVLPGKLAYGITRWKNVLMGMLFYALCKRSPQLVAGMIRAGVRAQLPEGYDLDRHFKPRYKPWDQRVCLVPDGDLFRTIRKGRATVVTDEIESFTEKGLKLKSGAELEADVVVSATGLQLLALGGAQLSVDGVAVDLSKKLSYKGMMLSGVPNLAIALGYTNASWTLKCDLTCEYVCRLLNHMSRNGLSYCVPNNSDPSVTEQPFIDFNSGYVLRAIDSFPKQGSKAPWKLYQNYALDLMSLHFGKLEDGAMEFGAAGAATAQAAAA